LYKDCIVIQGLHVTVYLIAERMSLQMVTMLSDQDQCSILVYVYDTLSM